MAIVNRAFADRFIAGQNAIGRYIGIDRGDAASPEWSEIVGIAGNSKAFYGPKEEDAQMYEPYLQAPASEMHVLLRAAGDVNLLAPALQSGVWSVDPDQPIGRALTVARLVDEQEGGDYVFDTLLGIFGAMALVLAAVGIYGVVAYSVAQRTHEIGIRMALGARRGDVLRRVVGKGMLLALASGALGLLAAAPLPKLFVATLQGFRVHSLAIFIGVPLLLSLVVLAAIYVPASRRRCVTSSMKRILNFVHRPPRGPRTGAGSRGRPGGKNGRPNGLGDAGTGGSRESQAGVRQRGWL